MGRLATAVWCEFQSDSGNWKSAALLLSTDTAMSPVEVIESFGIRWSIEPMFHQLKLFWGLKEAWQQTRQALHRWVYINMIGYGLTQLLGCIESPAVKELCHHSPRRRNVPVTEGQIRKGLVEPKESKIRAATSHQI